MELYSMRALTRTWPFFFSIYVPFTVCKSASEYLHFLCISGLLMAWTALPLYSFMQKYFQSNNTDLLLYFSIMQLSINMKLCIKYLIHTFKRDMDSFGVQVDG